MSKKDKKPSANWQPKDANKQPRGGSLAPNVPTMNFRWRSDRLDWDGPWCWATIGMKTAFGEIVPKLHEFESMTWAQVDGPTGSHFIDCDKLSKEAQDRLEHIQENADRLFSLRIAGKYRAWGVRDVATLRLLWWDPDHTVYPVKLKNT